MQGRRLFLAAGGAMVLVAGGGTALAAVASSGPVDASGVVYGCYTTGAIHGTHAILLQDAGTNCPKGTTAVSWNETGPAGPAGAAGPAGPAGPAGAAGPAGQQGPAGANGKDGRNVLTSSGSPTGSCTTGDSDIDVTGGDVWTCTASAWDDAKSSLRGPQGAPGLQGPAGPPGPAGTGGALNGTPCAFPGGAAGTVSVSTDASGKVTLMCVNPDCQHTTGRLYPSLVYNFSDCNLPLGIPGDATSYSQALTDEALNTFVKDESVGNPYVEILGLASCDGLTSNAAVVVEGTGQAGDGSVTGVTDVFTWTFAGPNAGYADASFSSTQVCPTSSDTTWY